jgi:hypothetical protein
MRLGLRPSDDAAADAARQYILSESPGRERRWRGLQARSKLMGFSFLGELVVLLQPSMRHVAEAKAREGELRLDDRDNADGDQRRTFESTIRLPGVPTARGQREHGALFDHDAGQA